MAEVEFHSEAAEEAEQAQVWYEQRRELLGEAFARELEEAIAAIIEAPRAWPIDGSGARQYVLRRFPYTVVFFELTQSRTIVLAVAHQRRVPGYWRNRMASRLG